MPLGAFLGSLAALGLALLVAPCSAARHRRAPFLPACSIAALASAPPRSLIFWSATGDSYREILGWLMGSLSGTGWGDAALVGLGLLVCAPVILFSGRGLDAFAFGDVAAATLGDRRRPACAGRCSAATALLTGVMVAVGGAIGFVGLVVPHAVRLVVGTRHRVLLPPRCS